MIGHKQKTACVCFISLCLVACSYDNDDLVHYIHEVKQRKMHGFTPFPSFAPIPGFKFPNEGERRSPFKLIDKKKQVNLKAPDKNREKQPLESFPLDSLKFVGTLKKSDEVWALIEKPNKDIAHVRVGDYIGQNFGRISSIKNDSIQLIETIKSQGKWEKHKITIELLHKR